MEWKKVNICDMCDSISATYSRGADMVVLINTSDVLDGKFLNRERVPNKDLKGQFKKTFKRDDILYSEIRPANKRFAYVDFDAIDYIASTKLMVLRAKPNVNPRFLYHILKSEDTLEKLQMLAESRSGTFPQITYSEMANVSVLLPDRETQDKIVAILSSLDDKIENNHRINRNLEAQAQALFKSWFVDFEPWGGKMPEDWKEYQLSELADVVGGYSYKGSELMPSEDAMATIKNFDRKGYFKLDGYKEIQISGRFKNTQILNLFDVVVAHTDITQQADIIGNPAIILSKGSYRNIIMSMDLCKVQPTHYAISSAFLYCLLKDSRFKSHALGYVNGTTVLHMSKKALPEYKVFLPSNLTKVQELGDQLKNLYKRYSVYLEENQRLAALRDTLLPKLMKGEIEL